MRELTLARRVLSGEAGWWASPVRAALSVGEFLYTGAIRARNVGYDRAKDVHSVPAPVISVGNITVGGTGKTPIVVNIVQRLERLHRSPAVIARGYGSAPGEANDEELLVRRYCPGVAYLADADRVQAATRAISRMGADVIVLDDGFQHRRLRRDLDVVLIDAMCPFGYGHVLPRGLLREPLSGLERASLILLTRSDQVSANEAARIESAIRQYNTGAPLLRSKTVVRGVERLDGAPVDVSAGKTVLAFAAIGRPQAFVATLKSLGLDVVATRWWPDHHAYRAAEIIRLLDNTALPPHDIVLTTEKDAVKLCQLRGVDPASIGVVKIGIEMLGDGDRVLDEMLHKFVDKPNVVVP